jgi:nucleoid DNA-binding protein
MNRGELVKMISEKENIPYVRAGKAVATILENVAQGLENGERVILSGFGSFCPTRRRGQKGRDPHTGEELLILPRKVVRFRPSKILIAKVR